MNMDVKRAILFSLIGESLKTLTENDLDSLTPLEIQKKLLENLDSEEDEEDDVSIPGGTFNDHSGYQTSTNRDVRQQKLPLHPHPTSNGPSLDDSGYQTSASRDVWQNKSLLQPYSTCISSVGPPIVNLLNESNSFLTTNDDSMGLSGFADDVNVNSGQKDVTSDAVVWSTLHYFKMILEMEKPHSSRFTEQLILSQDSGPLRTSRNKFDMIRGMEELVKKLIVLKRSKLDHNGDYHNVIVDLLTNVCIVNEEVRNCMVEVMKTLMKASSSDEESVCCLGLIIEDLCANNSSISRLMLDMMSCLLSTALDESCKKNEYSLVHSSYFFCLLKTSQTILHFEKCRIEKCNDKNYLKGLMELFLNLKNHLDFIVTKTNGNINIVVIIVLVRQIVNKVHDCLKSINLKYSKSMFEE